MANHEDTCPPMPFLCRHAEKNIRKSIQENRWHLQNSQRNVPKSGRCVDCIKHVAKLECDQFCIHLFLFEFQSMGPKEKKRFEDMAVKDKVRYEGEMANYTPAETDGKRKRKNKKDPNAPKRALSAFFFFCADERKEVKKSFPDYSIGEIAKELGRRWETCPNKVKFEAMAAKDKKRYEEVSTVNSHLNETAVGSVKSVCISEYKKYNLGRYDNNRCNKSPCMSWFCG